MCEDVSIGALWLRFGSMRANYLVEYRAVYVSLPPPLSLARNTAEEIQASPGDLNTRCGGGFTVVNTGLPGMAVALQR